MGLPYKVFDNLTGAIDSNYFMRSINKDSAEINDGNFYVAARSTTTLGASSFMGLQINAPASSTAAVHMRYDVVNSAGIADIYVFEIAAGSTYYSGTTSITPVNKNRNSTYAASCVVKWTTAIESSLTSTMASTQGTILDRYYINSTGTNISRIGSYYTEPCEYILKYNTTYVVFMINNSSWAGSANIRLTWYEE